MKEFKITLQEIKEICEYSELLNDVKTDAPKAKYQNSGHEKAEEVAETVSDDSWKIKKPNRKKYGY